MEVVKRSLAAKDVRILNDGEIPPSSEQTLACELPTGQMMAVSFEDRPANPDSARRRLENAGARVRVDLVGSERTA
jgi:hypothetical protein